MWEEAGLEFIWLHLETGLRLKFRLSDLDLGSFQHDALWADVFQFSNEGSKRWLLSLLLPFSK